MIGKHKPFQLLPAYNFKDFLFLFCRVPLLWEQIYPLPPGPVKDFTKDPRFLQVKNTIGNRACYILNLYAITVFFKFKLQNNSYT